MMIIRKKFPQAELDIKNPDIQGLTKIIDILWELESELKGSVLADGNKKLRLKILTNVTR